MTAHESVLNRNLEAVDIELDGARVIEPWETRPYGKKEPSFWKDPCYRFYFLDTKKQLFWLIIILLTLVLLKLTRDLATCQCENGDPAYFGCINNIFAENVSKVCDSCYSGYVLVDNSCLEENL